MKSLAWEEALRVIVLVRRQDFTKLKTLSAATTYIYVTVFLLFPPLLPLNVSWAVDLTNSARALAKKIINKY